MIIHSIAAWSKGLLMIPPVANPMEIVTMTLNDKTIETII